MNNLEVLQEFLKEHDVRSDHFIEQDKTTCNAIEQFADAFLIGNNSNAEGILCDCLDDSRILVRFVALYALLKAQKLGRGLQTKTLERLEKIEKSDDYHDLAVLKTVEKKFRAENRE